MTIELISQNDYDTLLSIYNNFKCLTLQNKGYEYINKTNFTKEEWAQVGIVETILNKHIKGFANFSNFRIKNDKVEIRFQYNYNYDGKGLPFTGVGHIFLTELLNGFDK